MLKLRKRTILKIRQFLLFCIFISCFLFSCDKEYCDCHTWRYDNGFITENREYSYEKGVDGCQSINTLDTINGVTVGEDTHCSTH
jgi:hypothetical protein